MKDERKELLGEQGELMDTRELLPFLNILMGLSTCGWRDFFPPSRRKDNSEDCG